MAPITIGFGFFLAVVGLVGWVATGREHVTALIPTFFGVALVFLGVLARRDLYRKHIMHAAVLIGLLGFLIPGGRLLMQAIHPPENPPAQAAVIEQLVMAIACAVFVGLCVKSFIAARRSRSTGSETSQSGGPSRAS